MDELKDVYSHFLLYYGRDIPKMQNAAKANRKKMKRVREEGDEEGECWERSPGGLMAMACPRMPLAECPLGLLCMCQILGSDWQLAHSLLFLSQVKVRRQKMRSRGGQSSSRLPAETCTPSARVLA